MDNAGKFLTNCVPAKDKEDVPNAVTWGVFPGQEILQPTVSDKNSFLAWKEEAFQIWSEWASVYETGSPTHKFLTQTRERVYLVNVVENDFVRGDMFRIFDQVLGLAREE